MDVEKLERRLSELENYVLALERQISQLNSEERIIVQDAHCLIQFFARVCDCCGIKHAHKTRSAKKSSDNFKESCEQQSQEKCRKNFTKTIPRTQRLAAND